MKNECTRHHCINDDCNKPSGCFLPVYLQETTCGTARGGSTKQRFTMNVLITDKSNFETRGLIEVAVFLRTARVRLNKNVLTKEKPNFATRSFY